MKPLFLTPTRRELLLAVNAGDVVEGPDEHGTIHSWRIDPPYAPRKVNARVAEMQRSGWVRLDKATQTWALTASGAAVLVGGGS